MHNSIKTNLNPREYFSKIRSHPNKNLGQNFIKDFRIIERITQVAELSSEDEVLEIGPGLGALTVALADKAQRVVAIEKDRKLYEKLLELLGEYTNIELINQDALKTDYKSLYKGKKLKVIANLPYSVSSPLLFKFLEAREYFSSLVLMLQQEVGERITASPGGKTYGSISVMLQAYFMISSEFRVSPESFWPKPKVDSVVLKLVSLDTPRAEISDEKLFEKVVRAAFSSRRKMLGNSMQSAFSKDMIAQALIKSGIDPKRRAETLSVEEFAKITENISV